MIGASKADSSSARASALIILIFLISPAWVFGQADEMSRAWNKPVAPFRIIGNLYYVGATEVSSFLITTPQGYFLIDGGFVETAPQIERNIATLGFKVSDIKFLLISHAHYDHVGGLAELKQKSGAKIVATAPDVDLLSRRGHGDFYFGDQLVFPPVHVDQVIADGQKIELGGQSLVAYLTPGHTKGNTTWAAKISDGKKTYDAVVAPQMTTLNYQFVGKESYPGIAADYETSFAILKTLPCDIFLAPHGTVFSLIEKRERLERGEHQNPFIDPDGYKRFVAQTGKLFQDKIEAQKKNLSSPKPPTH